MDPLRSALPLVKRIIRGLARDSGFWSKLGERKVLAATLEVDAELLAERGTILLIADKGFAGAAFEKDLDELGITLLRPSHKREKTVAEPARASQSVSPSASWPWAPRSGSTTSPEPRSLIAFDH